MDEIKLSLDEESKYLNLIFDRHFSWDIIQYFFPSILSTQLYLLSRFPGYQNYSLMKLLYFALIFQTKVLHRTGRTVG